jgi:quercetin dioxygenase-like cupin family protein
MWLRRLRAELAWREGRTSVRAWARDGLVLAAGATHYLVQHVGESVLHVGARSYTLGAGMVASCPGVCRIEGDGDGLCISHQGYEGLFTLCGPIEAKGRLRYIDGCTDTLLISPPVLGDPCLNHLHIPAQTRQTEHTHPSVRVGLIARGRGTCVTADGTMDLLPGLAFMLPPGLAHRFQTDTASLDVIVYHPETDTGPTHEDHPMLNRTIPT